MNQQIAQSPEDPHLYFKRAELFRLDRAWNAALADYQRAELLTPSMPEIDLARSRVLYDAGRVEEALAAAHHFLEKRPGHIAGHAHRAEILRSQKRFDAASRDYTRAIDAHGEGEKPNPHLYLERARSLSETGHLKEAVQGLDEGLSALGPIHSLQHLAIDLDRRRASHESALRRVDKILLQQPHSASGRLLRGDVLSQAGRLEEARQAYLEAIKAIEALPASRRYTRGVLELEAKAHQALAGDSASVTVDSYQDLNGVR